MSTLASAPPVCVCGGARGDLFLPFFVEGTDAGSVMLSKDSEKQGRRTESPSFQSGFFFYRAVER